MHQAAADGSERTDGDPSRASRNVERLRVLFPEVVRGERVDLAALRALLGTAADDDAAEDERYGLRWPGRAAARRLAVTPPTGRLCPVPDESADWDVTQNLAVEGENLEVLKLLRESHAGAVKLIYIDPPYNTGKDFLYADNFRDGVRAYRDIAGVPATEVGADVSGRVHAAWLSMMYPRLLVARDLLRADGVIFISIDHNELDHLLLLCRSVFGDANFCGIFVWEKKKKPSFLDASMGTLTDYIVCFARDRQHAPPFVAGAVADGKKYPFNNAGNGIQTLTFPPGSVAFRLPDQVVPAQDMSAGNIHTELLDAVEIVGGRNRQAFRLRGEWRYSQARLEKFARDGAEIVISKVPFRPNYVKRSQDAKKTANLLSYRTNGIPTNEDAREEMRRLFGADVMDYPKPSGLMQFLVESVTQEGDLVMDFFAGSGSTAHGVWNAGVSGAPRRFVLVQSPEPTRRRRGDGRFEASPAWDAGYATIAEVMKERLRRTAAAIRAEQPGYAGDLGFRLLRWEPEATGSPADPAGLATD